MNKLWYTSPAKMWKEALPLGNGLMGLMIYGGKKSEIITVNDGTLWSGYPKNYDSTQSAKNLDEVRSLIFAGKNAEADKLAEQKLTGFYSESYMPLGEIYLDFNRAINKDYRRELDLHKAIHTVSGVGIERKALVSYPDKVAVYSVTSQEKITVKISLGSKLKHEVSCDEGIVLAGNAPDYVAPNYLLTERKPVKYNEGKGMAFAMRLEVVTDGTKTYQKDRLIVKNANKIDVYIVTSTGFKGYDNFPSTDRKQCIQACRLALSKLNKDYKSILSRHVADYCALYNRVSLNISNSENKLDGRVISKDNNQYCDHDTPCTAILYKEAKKGKVDKKLVELFYNYGRYLTIAGSRIGGQPLNLQGIWNNSIRPPWSSNYTVNINAQMNYWGTSSSNLAECLSPYIDMIHESMQRGKLTAVVNYGCQGFACNHNVDIWRKTAPVKGGANYMFAPLCGVWLANELYEHYQYGGLEEHKEKIFEIVEQAAIFANDFLVLHNGQYVVAPSASPENVFINDNDGARCKLDYASAFDMALVKQIFDNYLQFGSDAKLKLSIEEKSKSLYPFLEGQDGICEWHKHYKTPEMGHRHFSPLYAFHPARVINYYGDAEQMQWIKKLFHLRIDNAKHFYGWSGAWAINIAARLREGNTANRVIENLLSNSIFKNLFDMHPPLLFQIDGNFGFVAGINEMLMSCQDGAIELLPALPREWSDGKISGIVAIGGNVLDLEWKGGIVTKLNISGDRKIKLFDKNIDSKVVESYKNDSRVSFINI